MSTRRSPWASIGADKLHVIRGPHRDNRNCLASGSRGNSVTKTALLDNWISGLSLIALTIAIHAIRVTFIVFVLHGFRVRLEGRNPLAACIAIVIGTITTTGLLLAALHMMRLVWAASYLWLGALGSLEAAEKVRRERDKARSQRYSVILVLPRITGLQVKGHVGKAIIPIATENASRLLDCSLRG